MHACRSTLEDPTFDEGKDRDAILVYARLIREKPGSVEAPFFQSHIVTCVARMGRKDQAVQQTHVFVKMLRDIEASPEGKDPKNARFITDARQDAERTLRVMAVQYHNEWKKTRDQDVARYAAEIYRDYLDVFPGEAPAYDMRYFHAELLYALEAYEEAGQEYERVALADVKQLEAQPPGKPGKYFKDALESTVYAYDLVVKKLDQTQKVQVGDARKRVPFTPQRQKLVDACERYLKHQPKGEKWVEIAYMAAHLYYDHNAFGEASDLFTRITLDHPTHQLAFYAANLVLDAYNQLGDWRNVSGWAKRFYANKALLEANPKLKEDLTRIIEQSAFKVIKEREDAKDWDGATEEYVAFARDWPASALAPTALYNASVAQVKAGRLDRAMEIRDQFMARYANHELAAACLYDNAEAYEAIGDFGEAAERYERYFAEWRRGARGEPAAAPKAARGKTAKGKGRHAAPAPAAAASAEAGKKPTYDEKKANDAIINAAVFRAGLKEWARAEADAQAYLDVWPDGADAPRLFLSIADLYERRNQGQKELAQLEEYQKKYAKDPDEWLAIQYRMAKRFEKLGNATMSRRLFEQGLAYYRQHAKQVNDRGLALVAAAQYQELEPDFAAYDRITLNVAPKYLKAQLQVKAKKLQALEAEYKKIVLMKQPEPAICALNKVAHGYRRYAQAIFDNPIPKEIRHNKDLVGEYKAQLAQLVEQLGLEKKATEFDTLAVTAARDYGVQTPCAREALAALQKAKVEDPGASPEVLPPLPPVAVADHPAGYGLLGGVVAQAAPRPPGTPRKGEPALPVLRQRPAAGTAPARADTGGARGDTKPTRAETGAANDPQLRTPDPDQPVPVKRKKKGADDDEDLLP